MEASLPFVIRIARDYRRWGIPLEDLIQQGNLGLLKAAQKFDPSHQCRLITYAVYWIRAEIRDYVVRGYRIVRLGSTRSERRAIRTYRRQPVPDPETLAAESGMPLERARKLWPLISRGDVSLEQPVGDQGTFAELVPSLGPTPEEEVNKDRLMSGVRSALKGALSALESRERRIVQERLMSDEPTTLEALGKEMGVSKERVRQLEQRARGKLREMLAEFKPAA